MPGFDGTGPMGLGPMTGGGRGSVLCHTEAMGPMVTVWEPLIIHPLADIHPMVAPSLVPSSALAVEGFHGVEAAVESLVVGEGFVIGGNSMGTSMEPVGIGHPIPISPRHEQKEKEVSLCPSVEVLDLEDGLRLGPMWAGEEEDCPDAGHMVPIGVHLMPTQIGLVHIPIPSPGIGDLME